MVEYVVALLAKFQVSPVENVLIILIRCCITFECLSQLTAMIGLCNVTDCPSVTDWFPGKSLLWVSLTWRHKVMLR